MDADAEDGAPAAGPRERTLKHGLERRLQRDGPRGRLLRAVQVAEGSLSQCSVSPRDALRPAVREGAHSVVFAHNHPSGVMRSSWLCGRVAGIGRGRGFGGGVGRHHRAAFGGES